MFVLPTKHVVLLTYLIGLHCCNLCGTLFLFLCHLLLDAESMAGLVVTPQQWWQIEGTQPIVGRMEERSTSDQRDRGLYTYISMLILQRESHD